MIEKINTIADEISQFFTDNAEELEQFRIKFLGSKGLIKQLFEEFKALPKEEKKTVGKPLNELKQSAQQKYDDLKQKISAQQQQNSFQNIDVTRPEFPFEPGSRHPLSIIKNEIIEIFNRIGYTVSEGPEIEDDWHNFTALNFPPEHPARDMQDTFFVEEMPVGFHQVRE